MTRHAIRTGGAIFAGAAIFTAAALTGMPAANATTPGSVADYDSDTHGDLALGVPEATVNGFTGAGLVKIVYGNTTGVDTTRQALISQSSTGMPGASETDDQFGTALARGDFDGDGDTDLAISQPGEDLGTITDAGAITIMTANGSTLTPPAHLLNLASDDQAPGDRLGQAMTAGDFNGDGKTDLLAMAPGSWRYLIYTTTSGTQPALTGTQTPLSLHLATKGSYAPKHTRSRQGEASPQTLTPAAFPATTTADLNGDGYDDAVINYRDTDGLAYLWIAYGSPTGLDTDNATVINGGGRTLAAGDINNDGYTDLVVGQPSSAESGTTVPGGSVTTYYGSPDGLDPANHTTIDQDTTGVPGAAETGDSMGASIATGDINGDGYDDVLTGLPGEDITLNTVANTDAGSAIVLYGSGAGLTGTGSLAITQDDTGLGAPETGDNYGSAVTLNDYTADGHADLTIGANGENTGDGTIHILKGTSTGPLLPGGQALGPTTLAIGNGFHIGTVLAP